MSGVVAPVLPTRRYDLPIKFELYDPNTGEGFVDVLKVGVDIPVDEHDAAAVNGDYTVSTNRGDVRLTYLRIGDVDFAPFREATLNGCSGMGYQTDDIQTKLNGLSFSGQYALPWRFDDVIDLKSSVHSITGVRYTSILRYGAARLEEVEAAGRVVVDHEKRSAAVREAASRCFLIRKDVGLCMAAEPPSWGVSDTNGRQTVRLYAVSPNRSRHDMFGMLRKDDAVAFARTMGPMEPEVGGEILQMPIAEQGVEDVVLAFAGEHHRFSRILSRNFSILDAEGIGFMHDCHQGSRSLRGYGTALDMLGLIERVRVSLTVRPDECRKWEDETRRIRHRLVFEAERAPAPIEGPQP